MTKSKLLLVAIGYAVSGYATGAIAEAPASPINGDVLAAVMELYGISEEAAVERLAKEELAAETRARILDEAPLGYAGDWFDAETLRLHVAVATEEGASVVQRFGGEPVRVQRSLDDLERYARRFMDHASANAEDVTALFVDVRRNLVVVETPRGRGEHARSVAAAIGAGRADIEIAEVDHKLKFSANVLGANGTRNLTWNQQYPADAPWPCSVGVSVEGGFATAGHCGYLNNQIGNASGTLMGYVEGSALSSGKDSGWVETVAGWTPTSNVNGYTNGTLAVSAKWSGKLESGVGSTLCRYGQTSGGPHCGTVNAMNVTGYFGWTVSGLTRMTGTCTEDGDSGGPFLTASGGQVQGTVTGSSNDGTCPADDTYVYFQPIVDTLNFYTLTMLTAHGAAAPTVSGFKCPDAANSGNGTYSCVISYWNSQGPTSVQWTRGNGTTSSNLRIFGSCVANQVVTASLAVSNSYGTYNNSKSFLCPMGPVP